MTLSTSANLNSFFSYFSPYRNLKGKFSTIAVFAVPALWLLVSVRIRGSKFVLKSSCRS